MTPELIAIITATVALAGLILNGNRSLNQRMDRLETRMDRLETRMDRLETRLAAVEREQAHLAGLLEGLREAIGGRPAA
jgi:outer membrane murein-binding lipoprotein Lpp